MNERRARPLLSASLRPLAPLAVVWLAGAVVLIAVVVQQGVPYEDLLLDPATTGRLPWYTGLVSNLGILGWAVATTMAAVGAWLSWHGRRRGATRFLARGAAISLILLLDDLFQLHVVAKPTLGLSKSSVYALYLIAVGLWLITDRAEIRRTRWPLLGAAGLALGSSVAVDQLLSGTELALVAEDAAKFLGILAWSVYFCTSVADISRSLLAGVRSGGGRWPEPGTGVNHPDTPIRIGSFDPGEGALVSLPSDEVAAHVDDEPRWRAGRTGAP